MGIICLPITVQYVLMYIFFHFTGIPEESIGQMVAKKAAKKRRSKEHHHNDTKEEMETMFKDGESHNKENVSETVRMNRSANRKRLLNLMQRAEASANEKKKAAMVKSIKDEERYKVIEQLASGKDSKRRSGDNVAKYRENKKPKELKRAIGKDYLLIFYLKAIS